MSATPEILLRLPEVVRRTGRRRSSIYSDMRAGRFPSPVKIGPRAIAWPESTVERWIAERVRAQDVERGR